MSSHIIRCLVCMAIVAGCLIPDFAEARGRHHRGGRGRGGRSSPFIKTADGLIPKSVYYGNLGLASPQKLAQYRKAEATAKQKASGKGKSTAKKPPIRKK